MSKLMDLCRQFSWQTSGALAFAGETVDVPLLDKQAMSDWIYRRFHAKPTGSDTETRPDWELLAQLKEATPYDTVPDPGWSWVREEQHGSVVAKSGVELLVPLNSVVPDDQELCSISLPAWRPYLSPGFFVLGGPVPLQDQDLARIYFSGSRDIGPHVVRFATGWRGAHELPWSLKVLGARASTRRTDAAVLYVSQGELPLFLDALRSSSTTDLLSPELSEFTCPVDRGVAWAFDSGTKASFGEWISTLIAEAVLEGRETSVTSAAIDIFRNAGVDTDMPWLCST